MTADTAGTGDAAGTDDTADDELQLRVERLRFLSSELLRVRAELAEATRAAAAATADATQTAARLRRLGNLRSVRAALQVNRAARAVLGVLRRRRRRGTVDRAAPSASLVRIAPPATLDPRTPASYRAELRARLRGEGASGGLRFALLLPRVETDAEGTTAGDVEAALVASGWFVATPERSGDLDAILSTDPAATLRVVPDGAIRIAWIRTATELGTWLDNPAFDEYDVVLAPREGCDELLRRTVHVPVALDAASPREMVDALRHALDRWLEADRIDVAIGPTTIAKAQSWGDYYFGRALQRALQRHGHPTRLRLRAAWSTGGAGHADIVIQLFGQIPRPLRSSQLNVAWIISHPDLVTDELLCGNDLVFAASDRLAAHLASRSGRPVTPLYQATDPDRFHPGADGPVHDLLFVAGFRAARRPVIDELTPTPLALAVYGRGWTADSIDPRHIAGDYVPNHELAGYYSAAGIVLNDHWADMAEWGVLSNRLYDAAASGAFVISDHVDGIEAEFDHGIATFRSGSELRRMVRHYLGHPEQRSEMALRAREAVVARHTFSHRVDALLDEIEPLARSRRSLHEPTS